MNKSFIRRDWNIVRPSAYIQREYVHSVSDAFCVLSKMTSEQPENVNIQKALDFTEQPWKFYSLTTTPSRLIPSLIYC